ncbi:MAG: metallophosphoesterase [Planctomycetota bacterium]
MSTPTLALVWVSVVTDLALGLWLLLRARPRPIGLARVAGAAISVVLFLLAKDVVCAQLGFDIFLGVSFAYFDLVFALPIFAVAVLLARRTRRVTKPVVAIACASFLAIPLGLYASFVEPYALTNEHATHVLSPQRAGTSPLVVVVLADIQTLAVGDHERDAIARAVDARPDLVLMPGDLGQVTRERFDDFAAELRELLAPLDPPLGVWFVHGDCESAEDARALLAGSNVKILENEIVELALRDRRVTLCGITLKYDSPGALTALSLMETRRGDDDVRIVFAHRPDVVFGLAPRTRVDLVVAGHTHGGQVQLPFFGPPLISSSVPRAVGAGGLHDMDGRWIYVSRGIGWEHGHAPPLRFGAPPEVSVLTLVSPTASEASAPAQPPSTAPSR